MEQILPRQGCQQHCNAYCIGHTWMISTWCIYLLSPRAPMMNPDSPRYLSGLTNSKMSPCIGWCRISTRYPRPSPQQHLHQINATSISVPPNLTCNPKCLQLRYNYPGLASTVDKGQLAPLIFPEILSLLGYRAWLLVQDLLHPQSDP